MQLYLLRHADADTPAPTDEARMLSEKGRAQARRVGKFCRENDILPEVVLTSPLVRAEETARIVAREIECEVVIEPFLGSGASPTSLLDGLRAYRFESMMIVGHEPDFSQLAATLLGIPDPVALRIRKASLAGLEVEAFRPACARLDFLIPAKYL